LNLRLDSTRVKLFSMNKHSLCTLFVLLTACALAQFDPAAGEPGSMAISKDSSIFVAWADSVIVLNRGPQNINDPNSPDASFGEENWVLGPASGTSSVVLSLGDGGSITLGFPVSIRDGEGPDFAVFENSFSDDFLELAHVEVSSDGMNFFRFPSISNTPIIAQVSGFGSLDPTNINNLAGKYRQGYGSPFDLEDLENIPGLNTDNVCCVRITDVVGTIDPQYGSYDSEGQLINDPYPTPFESSGFDLDAVGIIHSNEAFLQTQKSRESEIRLFPNPTDRAFFIEGLPESGELRIYGASGNLVYVSQVLSGATQQFELELDRGIYVVDIITPNHKTVLRLLKD
jgi:hypothetical protein